MIAVDTNVLVYAHRQDTSFHQAAKARLSALATGRLPWAIPVFCLGELVRVLTHRRIFASPHTASEARTTVNRMLGSPSLRLLTPGPSFTTLFLDALIEADAVGNLVFDAQIVALCREAGVQTLLTQDRDFDRFSNFLTERLPTPKR